MHGAHPDCIALYTLKEARYVAQPKRPKHSGHAQGDSATRQPRGETHRITAAKLAEEAGCSVRRVRDLVQLGLISRAIGEGRARRYTRAHVEQLRTVLRALDQAGLTRSELLWVLDRGTPTRLRRQAHDLGLLLRPSERRPRIYEIELEGHLSIAIAGPVEQHQASFLAKILARIADELRSRADAAEELRARLTLPRTSIASR